MALTDLIRQRLNPERRSRSITLRIPEDVVDTLKLIAPQKGLSGKDSTGYQTLLKMYISEGIRKDEAIYLEQLSRTEKSDISETDAAAQRAGRKQPKRSNT